MRNVNKLTRRRFKDILIPITFLHQFKSATGHKTQTSPSFLLGGEDLSFVQLVVNGLALVVQLVALVLEVLNLLLDGLALVRWQLIQLLSPLFDLMLHRVQACRHHHQFLYKPSHEHFCNSSVYGYLHVEELLSKEHPYFEMIFLEIVTIVVVAVVVMNFFHKTINIFRPFFWLLLLLLLLL